MSSNSDIPKDDWDRGRAHIARKYFRGDQRKAELFLLELPYSKLPEWADLDEVLARLGEPDVHFPPEDAR